MSDPVEWVMMYFPDGSSVPYTVFNYGEAEKMNPEDKFLQTQIQPEEAQRLYFTASLRKDGEIDFDNSFDMFATEHEAVWDAQRWVREGETYVVCQILHRVTK